MKSEPPDFSVDDLAKVKKTLWTGVRNYQARNFMITDMKVGDAVLFYHSNAEPPGVVGLARVSQRAQPDPTQFDKTSKYYDESSDKKHPRWSCVEIEFVSKFPEIISLQKIKSNPKLKTMELLKRGNRLSIQPVTAQQFHEFK